MKKEIEKAFKKEIIKSAGFVDSLKSTGKFLKGGAKFGMHSLEPLFLGYSVRGVGKQINKPIVKGFSKTIR